MRRLLAGVALLVLVAVGCGDDDDPEEATITVFAAASLTDVFARIADDFEEANPGTTVELSFGPSSGLVTQITEGAQADVIATADTTTMDALVAGDVLDGDPTAFATNGLELALPRDNPGEVVGLADLAREDLVVGLCAEEVPCGRSARQALEAAGVVPSVDTEEEDVRALMTKVEAGEVDVGVVYRTDVYARRRFIQAIPIPPDQNVVATYPVATLTADGRAFVAFVLSDEGQAALAAAGFGPPG